jgi:hypothetical protein
MAKHDTKEIDELLAGPLGGDEPEGDEREEGEEDEGALENEALEQLFAAAKGDDLDAFKEAFRKAVEACVKGGSED